MTEPGDGYGPLKQGGRMPALRNVVMIDTFLGRPRIRKWPRKRGPAKTVGDAMRQRWFAWANEVAKRSPPQTIKAAIERTRFSGFYPRDYIISALFGNIAEVVFPSGKRYLPMSARKNVSDNLDLLGKQIGSMLHRTPQGWRAIPPDPPALAGGHWFLAPPVMQPNQASAPAGGNFFVGVPVIFAEPTRLAGFNIWFHSLNSIVSAYAVAYQGASNGALTGGALLGHGAPIVPVAGQINSLELTDPITFPALTPLYLGAVVRGTGFTTALGDTRRQVFFAHSTDTPPTTAPTASVGASTNTPFWGFPPA